MLPGRGLSGQPAPASGVLDNAGTPAPRGGAGRWTHLSAETDSLSPLSKPSAVRGRHLTFFSCVQKDT